jgi:hypothetical protein
MNKKFTLSAVFTLITIIGFAQCPTYFARNNGNGTCSSAEVKMYFSTCPTIIPTIDSIYSNGKNLKITMLKADASNCASKGYISYCISSDIPPVNTLQVFFNFGGTTLSSTACSVSTSPVEAGPTPVILSSFEARRADGNSVVANWKTEQEINADKYEIQRSTNKSSFETIGTVFSKTSNSSVAQSYSFTDRTNNSTEVSLYRIKMIDKDNTFSYSPVETVKGLAGKKSDFTVYPNPSVGNAKVTISDLSEPTNIMVYDNSGRLIKHTTLTNSNSFDLNNLQKGGYFIKVTGEKTGSSSVKKLAVIN